jgi:hypothetical protein
MTYFANVSFDMQRNNLVNSEEFIEDIAYQNNCGECYFIYELEGQDKHIKKSQAIYICELSDNITDICKFLKTLGRYRKFKIDCIYTYDNDMIYCSRIYNKEKNGEIKNKMSKYSIINKKIYNLCC